MTVTVFIYSAPFPEVIGSVQLQAFIPARHLGAKALYFGPTNNPNEFLDCHRPDVLIFTKIFDPSNISLATTARSRGIKIVGSFCDLHLADELGQRNKRLSAVADAIVAPTEYLAAKLREHLRREITVIEEPLRYPRQPVRFEPGTPLRIIWHGHSDNHDTLPSGITKLAAYRERPITLMILSNIPPRMDELAKLASGMPINFYPWSPGIQYEFTTACDMVFLPSLDTDSKKAKGHDRLAEAINAGRLAIAHPLPPYRELEQYCCCSDDYAASVRIALANPDRVREMLAQGQTYIDTRFAPEIVAEKWRALLTCLKN